MREVLQLLSVLTDDSRFIDTFTADRGGKEPKNMCEVLDKIENRGRQLGIKQGIEQGDMNRAKKVAFRLKQKGLPVEEIAEVVETDVNTVFSWIHNMPDDN